ncbi:MAG: DUF2508 family protein [Eubacteriales bacterium]|nr:DUF2508 family protein [Eubacteriales bacterium]
MLRDFLRHVRENLSSFQPPGNVSDQINLAGEALIALNDLKAAESYFNSISDPDLLEYASYEIEAARRKYEYLIRRIRQEEYDALNATTFSS